MSDDIPPELYQEILRYVPVESLLRFRSVCKAWCRIIDDPSFSKLHVHRGTGSNWLILRNNNGKLYSMPLSNLRSPADCEATHIRFPIGEGIPRPPGFPVDSCDGLMLISPSNQKMSWVVWNPSTGELLKLPSACDHEGSYESLYKKYPHSGIGYDESSGDYKAVKIIHPYTYVCSMHSRSWRRIQDFPDVPKLRHPSGVFVNGALHWVADGENEGWIIALDLRTETYRRLPLPSSIIRDKSLGSVGLDALGGKLFLNWTYCWTDLGMEMDECYVLMLADYAANSWVKLLSLGKKPSDFDVVRVIAYFECEKEILLRYEEGLFWYNVESNVCMRKVHIHGGITPATGRYSSQAFPVSIVRLKRSNDADESMSAEGMSKLKISDGAAKLTDTDGTSPNSKKRKVTAKRKRSGSTSTLNRKKTTDCVHLTVSEL